MFRRGIFLHSVPTREGKYVLWTLKTIYHIDQRQKNGEVNVYANIHMFSVAFTLYFKRKKERKKKKLAAFRRNKSRKERGWEERNVTLLKRLGFNQSLIRSVLSTCRMLTGRLLQSFLGSGFKDPDSRFVCVCVCSRCF